MSKLRLVHPPPRRTSRTLRLLTTLKRRGVTPKLVNGRVQFTNAHLMTVGDIAIARDLSSALTRFMKGKLRERWSDRAQRVFDHVHRLNLNRRG